jgi:hypothetical protein
MGKATAAAMMAETNALVEGGDVVEEQEREPARVPLAMDEIYRRLDRELRRSGNALLAEEVYRPGPLTPVDYQIFEAQLMEGGLVRTIDLVQRAREVGGVIQDCESPILTWPAPPR